jgi:hypothetical protein
VAVCLDFDGTTLAPIVEDPAAWLASHAAASGVRYLGMYELEELVAGRAEVDPRLAEAPAELLDAADLVVDGPEGVRAFQERLLA